MVNLIGRDRGAGVALPVLNARAESMLEARIEIVSRLCAAADPAQPLARRYRTPAFEPDLEDDPSLAGMEAVIHDLAERRAAALASPCEAPHPDPDAALPGVPLLIVDVTASQGDGRAEAASRGFFDVDDLPPWDLWLIAFGLTRPDRPEAPRVCLGALVPEACVPIVEAGLQACRSGCLHLTALR